MKKCLCALVTLVLVVVVAGCGGSKGQAGNTASNGAAGSSKQYAELRWGETTFAGPIELLKTIEPSMASAEQLAVQDLMEYEPSGKVKLGVASSVEHTSPTAYVYHLKPVKFSNGTPLTAADVVFSLKRNLGPVWTKGYWEDVASVSARGSSTVVIKLKRPSAIWEYVLAASGQILEQAQVEKVGTALGTPGNLPIGTGPWKLDSYQPEASIQLSRNPYWTGQPQPAAKINISLFKSEASLALALRSGAIDGTFRYNSPKTFENIPGIRQLTAPGDFIVLAAINTSRPPFNDVHVRRAIAYATDVSGMIRSGFPGGAAVESASIVPIGLFGGFSASQVKAMLGALPKYHFDLAMAKQELAKSAYPHGFTMKIQAGAIYSNEVQAAEILSADLAKIGITAKLQEIQPDEESRLSADSSKLVTMDLAEDGSVYSDPEGMFASFLPASQIGPPGSGLNAASYRNAEVEKLEAQELETLNPEKRLQLIGKMLQAVGSEVPYLPLYTLNGLAAVSEKFVYPTFSVLTSVFTTWALDVKLAS